MPGSKTPSFVEADIDALIDRFQMHCDTDLAKHVQAWLKDSLSSNPTIFFHALQLICAMSPAQDDTTLLARFPQAHRYPAGATLLADPLGDVTDLFKAAAKISLLFQRPHADRSAAVSRPILEQFYDLCEYASHDYHPLMRMQYLAALCVPAEAGNFWAAGKPASLDENDPDARRWGCMLRLKAQLMPAAQEYLNAIREIGIDRFVPPRRTPASSPPVPTLLVNAANLLLTHDRHGNRLAEVVDRHGNAIEEANLENLRSEDRYRLRALPHASLVKAEDLPQGWEWAGALLDGTRKEFAKQPEITRLFVRHQGKAILMEGELSSYPLRSLSPGAAAHHTQSKFIADGFFAFEPTMFLSAARGVWPEHVTHESGHNITKHFRLGKHPVTGETIVRSYVASAPDRSTVSDATGRHLQPGGAFDALMRLQMIRHIPGQGFTEPLASISDLTFEEFMAHSQAAIIPLTYFISQQQRNYQPDSFAEEMFCNELQYFSTYSLSSLTSLYLHHVVLPETDLRANGKYEAADEFLKLIDEFWPEDCVRLLGALRKLEPEFEGRSPDYVNYVAANEMLTAVDQLLGKLSRQILEELAPEAGTQRR